jgi:hypothetical protein
MINENSVIEFAEKWYVVRQAVVDPDSARFYHDHVVARANSSRIALGDKQISNAPVAYCDPLTDTLLEEARDRVEQATGLRLWPTFSYFRVYQHGNVLKAHRDRPSCEVSMTVNLGIDADEPWPIWIAGPMGTAAVTLQPGDGLVYRGCDCFHWREPFPGNHLAQVFLHYVDRDGPNAEWKFDKRPALAGQ